MNRRWEQVSQCVTGRDSTGQALCSVASSVFGAVPSKDQKQLEQRKRSSSILEVSPLILQRTGRFSVGGMAEVGGG